MLAERPTRITLARILRPRGLRGEVAAEILTDFPERLPELREVWLSDGRSAPRRAVVRHCWLSSSRGGQAVFLFAGVEDRDAAEHLRGVEVQIPREQRARLASGSFYVDDLVGCEVWEADATKPLGTVHHVEFPGGVALLAVQPVEGNAEVLVPLAAEICRRIDVAAKRIDVSLPEGLLDLNRG